MNDPEAALRRLREVTRSYPERLAAARTAAAERGRSQISGTSGDESATAVVDGNGTIVSVTFSTVALRKLDSVALGQRAAEAINAALDEADRRQRPDAAEDSLERTLDEALDTLNYRLDGVLNQLGQIERGLES